ncbi:MAG: WD40 repeat domain-containing serine/threonine protein kinase [Planctomycetaceae bacterium]
MEARAVAEAEAAFARWLALLDQGEAIDFDAYCAQRPEQEKLLRILHARWTEARESGRRSIRQYVGKKLAEGGDEGVSLEPEPPKDLDSAVRQKLQRLAAQVPQLPRYLLQGEVARGGMGVILKVWDQDLRRTLAMKVILGKVDANSSADTPVADTEYLSRFLEEAQITGQLDHPGVVPVHEIGVDGGGRVFFTMRMVKGRNLEEIFDLARKGEEGWTRTRALGVLLKVCEAMAYAHSKGVLHRDLKPANIMVGKFGETYVMDWGLAKVMGRRDPRDLRIAPDASMTRVRTDRREVAAQISGSPVMTMDGTVVGTPAYMPPEQAAGRIEELDQRADVYAVGALLYRLLTGQMPYVKPGTRTTGYEVLQRLMGGPPDAVHALDATVPGELAAICEKAMARELADRYPSMEELSEDLRAYLEGRVVRAYETGAVAEFRKWVSRNKGTAAAIAGLLLLAVGGTAIFAWQQRAQVRELRSAQEQIERARSRAEENERKALASESEALVNESRAMRQSYVANIVAADASLRTNAAREALLRLESCPPALRGWEWRYLHGKADSSRLSLRGHEGAVTGAAFEPGGTRLASCGEDSTVRLWDPATGQEAFRFPGTTDAVTALAFSPDGSRLAAAARDNLVRIWDASTGRLLGALAGHEGAVNALAFSADGKRIVTGSADESMRVWDAAGYQLVAQAAELGRPVEAVAFAPSGELVAIAVEDVVELRDATTLNAVAKIAGHEGRITSLAFSPDGTLLASASLDTTARLWSAGNGAPVAILAGHSDPVFSVDFDASGERLVTASYDSTVRLWAVPDGAPLRVLLGHSGAVRCARFDAHGARIVSASADRSVRLWDAGAGGAVLVIDSGEDYITSVALAPGGESLASGSSLDGTIRIRDMATGEERKAIAGIGGGVNAVAYSPDGSLLASGGEEDSTGRLFDAKSGALLRALVGHEASVTSLAFAPDGSLLATGSADNTARLWATRTGECTFVLAGHAQRVAAVAFAAGGAGVATASFDRTVRLWSPSDGELQRVLEGHGDSVTSVAFGPSGRLASGSADQTIRLWDPATGATLATLRGHAGAISCLAFSPDGSRLASGSFDKTVRVWDLASSEPLLTIPAHKGWVTSLAWSADGTRIVSGSLDHTVKVWRAE